MMPSTPSGFTGPSPNGAHGSAVDRQPAPDGQAIVAPPSDQETTQQLRKLFEVWVDSELKAQVVIFFNNNPGVVETVDGLAKRLGLNAILLREAVADHVRLGLLQERRLGEKTVLVFNRDRRKEIQSVVVDALDRRTREAAS